MIPKEDFKSQIIGRDGCDIRVFQNEMGVKVIIDNTPNSIYLSGNDERKLMIAKLVMERLVQDKKISPDAIKRYKKIYG